MTRDELVDALEQGVSRSTDDYALVFTFIARTTRGLPIRARVLDWRDNGEKIYGVTRKQAVRWLTALRAAA